MRSEPPPLSIHTYKACDTCRKAVAWLRERGLAFEERPIREQPPSPADLRRMLKHVGGDLRRLFNTSGRDYRTLGLSAKLPTLSEEEALALLAANGNLVKRPFLLGPDTGLVGFDPLTWAENLN